MEHTIADYNGDAATRSVPEDVQLQGVQAFRQCVHSLYSANPYKAPSFDQVSNSLLSTAPIAVARHYHPVLAKTQFTVAEPFEFKGSISHPLPKADKTPLRAKSYRSVSLKNDGAKHHHKFLRATLSKAVTVFSVCLNKDALKVEALI